MRHDPFSDMLEALAAIYEGEADPQGPHTAHTLRVTPSPVAFDARSTCLLDTGIRSVLSSSPLQAAQAILAVQDRLPWGSNPVEDNTEANIAAMISVATLMGPEGPIPAPDVRLGLVYMRPDCYYPLHIHDADETYVILGGQALWTAGDDVQMRGSGDMVHHPSLMPHAFRTGPEGFVALWRWSGDINLHSYAFVEEAAAELPA
ncbi:dimethylsulfonioproprionate lyase family protein [Marivita sp.]|uniref:dimethylsulfonioproprionate lyase family protein n=1 Tax=Marivita sp. TaxID=2003365 RepID=UPI003B58F9C3